MAKELEVFDYIAEDSKVATRNVRMNALKKKIDDTIKQRVKALKKRVTIDIDTIPYFGLFRSDACMLLDVDGYDWDIKSSLPYIEIPEEDAVAKLGESIKFVYDTLWENIALGILANENTTLKSYSFDIMNNDIPGYDSVKVNINPIMRKMGVTIVSLGGGINVTVKEKAVVEQLCYIIENKIRVALPLFEKSVDIDEELYLKLADRFQAALLSELDKRGLKENYVNGKTPGKTPVSLSKFTVNFTPAHKLTIRWEKPTGEEEAFWREADKNYYAVEQALEENYSKLVKAVKETIDTAIKKGNDYCVYNAEYKTYPEPSRWMYRIINDIREGGYFAQGTEKYENGVETLYEIKINWQ